MPVLEKTIMKLMNKRTNGNNRKKYALLIEFLNRAYISFNLSFPNGSCKS